MRPFVNLIFVSLVLATGLWVISVGIARGQTGMPFVLLGLGILGYALALSIRSSRENLWRSSLGEEVKLRIKIDQDACMGAASCVTLAPRVFKLDDQNLKSTFISRAPLIVLDEKAADNETLILAAQSCPFRAIIIESTETGERIYP